jgi:hypothetical protein
MSDDVPEWAENKARVLLADNPAIGRAMDVLLADGMPEDRCAELLLASHGNGDDVEAFARHFVKLRKAMRGER